MTLEERVPNLKDDDLEFVKACLSIDPSKRPTTGELLKFKYLSIKDHPILSQYEETLSRTKDSRDIQEESKDSSKCASDQTPRDDLSSAPS